MAGETPSVGGDQAAGAGKREAPAADHQRVGATLRTLRELRGFTVDELATEMGISRPYLAHIEAGRKSLSEVLLARAAQALRVRQLAIMRSDVDETAARDGARRGVSA